MIKKVKEYFSSLWDKKILVKAIIYRILAFSVVFGISLLLTGKYDTSFLIGFLSLLVKFILYYVYELVWKKINFKKIIGDLEDKEI